MNNLSTLLRADVNSVVVRAVPLAGSGGRAWVEEAIHVAQATATAAYGPAVRQVPHTHLA